MLPTSVSSSIRHSPALTLMDYTTFQPRPSSRIASTTTTTTHTDTKCRLHIPLIRAFFLTTTHTHKHGHTHKPLNSISPPVIPDEHQSGLESNEQNIMILCSRQICTRGDVRLRCRFAQHGQTIVTQFRHLELSIGLCSKHCSAVTSLRRRTACLHAQAATSSTEKIMIKRHDIVCA